MVAGKVAITFDGDWNADKPYDRLVAVRFNENCYISKKESTGIEPTNEEYWFLAVRGGTSVATNEKAGIVKPDGITIMIDEDGKISVPIDESLSLESENAVQNKAVMGYVSQLSNPNLLLNPDFKINTSGKYSWTGVNNQVTVNNWLQFIDIDGVVKLSNGTITLDNTNGKITFGQFITNPELYEGETVTLSALVMQVSDNTPSGVIYVGANGEVTGTCDLDGNLVKNEWVLLQTTVTLPSEITTNLNVVIYMSDTVGSVIVKWMKLEIGAIATPFVPPNRDIELYKCIGANSIYSNPNLIINPDFKINQRGQSRYDTATYGVDRWTVGRGSDVGYVEPAATGLHIVTTGTGKQHVIQPIEGDFAGKTLTVSYKCSNIKSSFVEMSLRRLDNFGNPTTNPTTSNINTSIDGIYSRTFTISEDYHGKIALLTGAIDAVINWVKLEYGSVATPFIEPNPTTELLKCQRYFEPIGINWDNGYVNKQLGFIDTNGLFVIEHTFSVPKRVTPTITTPSSTKIEVIGYADADTNTFETYPRQESVRINGTIGTNYANKSCSLYGHMYADAEIY